MNIRHTSARVLLGAVTLTLAASASLAATGSAEAAGLPGQGADHASRSSAVSARTSVARTTKTGTPHRFGRAGLPG